MKEFGGKFLNLNKKLNSLLKGRGICLFNITYEKYTLQNPEFMEYYRHIAIKRHKIWKNY